jgi:hypothetical protein
VAVLPGVHVLRAAETQGRGAQNPVGQGLVGNRKAKVKARLTAAASVAGLSGVPAKAVAARVPRVIGEAADPQVAMAAVHAPLVTPVLAAADQVAADAHGRPEMARGASVLHEAQEQVGLQHVDLELVARAPGDREQADPDPGDQEAKAHDHEVPQAAAHQAEGPEVQVEVLGVNGLEHAGPTAGGRALADAVQDRVVPIVADPVVLLEEVPLVASPVVVALEDVRAAVELVVVAPEPEVHGRAVRERVDHVDESSAARTLFRRRLRSGASRDR